MGVKQPEHPKPARAQLTANPSDLVASNFPPAWLAGNIFQEDQPQDVRFLVCADKEPNDLKLVLLLGSKRPPVKPAKFGER